MQGIAGNEAAARVCSTRSDWHQSYSEGVRWASSGVNAGDMFSSGSSYPSGGHDGNSPPQEQPGTPIIDYDPLHRIKLGDPIPPTYRLMEKYDECRGPGLWVVAGGDYLDLSTGIDVLDQCNKNTSGKAYFWRPTDGERVSRQFRSRRRLSVDSKTAFLICRCAIISRSLKKDAIYIGKSFIDVSS